MNIPELKNIKEAIERTGLLFPKGIYGRDALNVLISLAQLVCDVSDKMLPKKEGIEFKGATVKCRLPEDCRFPNCDCGEPEITKGIFFNSYSKGYNLARSEDILWLTKKMMGLEDIVSDIVFKNCQLTYADAGKKIANAIRQKMGGEE